MSIKKLLLVFAFTLYANITLAQSAWGVLASPYRLQVDSSVLIISDYFPFDSKVEKVEVPKGINRYYIKNGELVLIGKPQDKVSFIRFYVDGEKYDLPCFSSDKENVEFKVELEVPTNKLEIKGTFSSWTASDRGIRPLEKTPTKNWTITLKNINTGIHQYKLIADGKELNPLNKELVPNGMGGTNVKLLVGSNNEAAPVLTTNNSKGKKITINATDINGYVAFWNHRLIGKGNTAKKVLKLKIPSEAKKVKRSYIRVYAFSNSKISNDLLIPLEYGKVVIDASLLDRTDLHTQRMYFMMVDRFYDGDKSNNPAKLLGVEKKADFLGGDISGIQQKIEAGFFNELGFNTIWLSPISKNSEGAWGYWDKGITTKFSAYHGYWPTSYSLVDRRFGTNKGFSKLISQAHAKNMNVILDFVAHHIHIDHPLYQAHPTWVTPLYLPDGSMNTERWDDHRLTTWFDTFLPTLNFELEEVNNIVSDSVMFWVKNFNLDGFRHDASKHVPEKFWRTLTRKIRIETHSKNRANFYQIGETYGSPELISSYVNSGQMDAQFDFNMYDAGVMAFALDANKEASIKNFNRLSETLQESFKYYGSHHLMGNISGNQDKPRFTSLAEGTIRPDEDTKLAGWTRAIEHQGKKGYMRMAQMMALNFTIPGIPVVYYGDEIAMPGGNDPDNRRMMQFEGYTFEEKQLRDKVKLLAQLRTNRLELIYGDFKELKCTEGFYAYERNYFGKKSIIVFSKNAGKVVVTREDIASIKTNFEHLFQLNGNEILFEMKDDDFEIFTYEK